MIHHEFTTLGKTIRQLRQGRKLSQETFAEICGLHRTYICDVERGVRNVTIGTLLRIAHALGTTVSELTRNLENEARPPEKSQTLLYMNATKVLIGVTVLFLATLSAQAQSILENIIFESAIASSVLQEQVGSDVSMADPLPGWNASIDGNNAAFMEASIAPEPGQTGQIAFNSEFNNNGSTRTEFDDISFPNVTAPPEPSSMLLFGGGGSAVALYKRKRSGYGTLFDQRTRLAHMVHSRWRDGQT
ncbi:MAG: helix-turn-helix domain-containing protein [Limisphaerales bacterium]